MPAHTPGPWTVGGEGTLKTLQGHVFAGSRLVANCYGHQDGKAATLAESDANARLIATAPRMLDLVKHVAEVGGYVRDDAVLYQEARAILRDVKGESHA